MSVLNGACGLFLEVRRAAIPELGGIVCSIPNDRSSASQDVATGSFRTNTLAMQAHARFAAVGKAEVGVMTMGTGDGVFATQDWVKVQQLAQIDLGRSER